jgi:PAS domain S-box-containing protein
LQHAPEAITAKQPAVPVVAAGQPADDSRFLALVELAPDAIVVTDEQGRITLVNQQTEQLFGYRRTELLGHLVELLLPERLHAVHRQHRASYMSAPRTRPMGTRLVLAGRHRDGHEFPVEVSLSPVPSSEPHPRPDGQFAVMGIIRDVSERLELARTRAEAEAARQQARRLVTILDAMTDAVGVYNADGNVVQTNAALRRLLALDADSSYSTLSPDSRATRIAARHPDGRPLSPEEYGLRRLLRGEVLTGEDSMEVVVTALDGREMWLSITGAPLRDEHGCIVGAVAVSRDVTEPRKQEQRTHQALHALLAMADVLVRAPGPPARGEAGANDADSPPLVPPVEDIAAELAELTASVLGCRRVGLVAVDPETREQRALAVVGLSAEQETQWWGEQVHLPRYGEGADPALLARFAAGEALVLDMTAPPYDSLPNTYGITTSLYVPLLLRDTVVGILSLDHGGDRHEYTGDERALAEAVGRLTALVIERERLLREREEARANELALRAANQRLDEFLGIASHELKTPITALKANTQLAVRRLRPRTTGASPSAPLSEREQADVMERLLLLLTRVEGSIDKLVRLVDDLLDVSRIQVGKLEFRLDACDLVGLVHEFVEEQRELHPQRRIHLRAPAGPVQVTADADRIGQVVTNFLTNALKYSKGDRPVEVRVDVAYNLARASVRDAGPGLAPDQREQVWERFYRAPGVGVQSGSDVGLGLGLYICRTIIERHGGQVGVDSQEGVGSTFWFSLPLSTSPI